MANTWQEKDKQDCVSLKITSGEDEELREEEGGGGRGLSKTYHKSGPTEAGVAMARLILDAHSLVAWLQQALINVIFTVKACPTCQEQKPRVPQWAHPTKNNPPPPASHTFSTPSQFQLHIPVLESIHMRTHTRRAEYILMLYEACVCFSSLQEQITPQRNVSDFCMVESRCTKPRFFINLYLSCVLQT